jgi:cytochrome c biogenesis protein CcdA
MALVGALTPLVKVARTHWIRAALLYTFAGSSSALITGTLLGLVGSSLRANRACWLIIPVALILAARDLEWLHFEIPERKCQTEKVWAHEFGFVTASAMWGFHLGFGFNTYIRYGGFWVLALTALAMGNAKYGALLLLVYWVGRVMPVWTMPIIWRTQDVSEMANAILATRHMYNKSDALGLIWSAGVLTTWVLKDTGIKLLIGHVQ